MLSQISAFLSHLVVVLCIVCSCYSQALAVASNRRSGSGLSKTPAIGFIPDDKCDSISNTNMGKGIMDVQIQIGSSVLRCQKCNLMFSHFLAFNNLEITCVNSGR